MVVEVVVAVALQSMLTAFIVNYILRGAHGIEVVGIGIPVCNAVWRTILPPSSWLKYSAIFWRNVAW